jgi:phosphatidylinositol alpha-mannosyltransferase
MKIGLVSEFYYPWPGGVSEHTHHLAQELRARGHVVKIVTGRFDNRFARLQAKLPGFSVGSSHLDSRAPDEEHVIRFGRSVAFPYNGGIASVTVGARLSQRLSRLFENEAFDLVHVHDPLAPTLPLLAVSLATCPVVGTFHAFHQTENRLLQLFRRPLRGRMERLAARVAVSRSAREAFQRYFGELDYRIVPNGVDIERFQRNGRTLAQRFDARKKNILYVGQFVKKKGFGVLLEAFHAVRERREDVRLLVVGDGPLERAFRKQARADDVHFLGHLRGKALAACYEVADLFVAPSIGFESFGITLLEAMAAGIPIVASDIAGFRNVISHDTEAVLVPPDDVAELARAIERVIDEPDLARALVLAGKDTVKGYSWTRVVDMIESVYSDVLPAGVASERVVDDDAEVRV